MTLYSLLPLLQVYCFNPCFGGSYIVTLPHFSISGEFSVSILVLVDLIL